MKAPGDRTGLQLFLIGLVPLVFLLVLCITGATLVYQTQRVATLSRTSTALLAQSAALIRAVEMSDRGLSDYQAGQKHGVVEYRQGIAAMRSHATALLAMVPKSSPDRTEAQRYVSYANAGVRVLSQYFAYLQAGNASGARRYAQSPAVQKLARALAAAEVSFNDREQATTTDLFGGLSKVVRFYSEAVLWICVTGLLATLLTVRGLSRAARRLRDALKQKNEFFEAYQREHLVVSTLQRALLPLELPAVPGVRIDAAYVPAAKGADIGGDWYDVFALSERTIAIGVGDVLGHDLYAATVMASARQAIRIAAREDADPARVLGRVNRFLCSEEARLVTAFFGTFDLIERTLSYATAGHPLPIVIHPDGSTSFLDGRGLMLGINPRVAFTTYKERLDVGSALVLYTDGLIEAERDYIAGMTRLEAAVRLAVSSASDNIAERIHEQVLSGIEPEDDSAILFFGVTEGGESFDSEHSRTWNVNAKDEASARRVKRALLGYLGEFASRDSSFETVETIVGELVSNVARHTPGLAELTLTFSSEGARLSVRDRGKSFPDRGERVPAYLDEGGRGLFIVRTLAADFRVECGPQGNLVSVVLPICLEKWLYDPLAIK